MSLLRHPRPAGVAALLVLVAAAGPAFARTGLQSEHDQVIAPLLAQMEPSDTDSTPAFDHGENDSNHDGHLGTVGHDRGGHGHGGHGGGRGR